MLAQKQHIVLCAELSVVLTTFPVYAARVSLSWIAPTTNQDGTALTDLAGYEVYYGIATLSYDVPSTLDSPPAPSSQACKTDRPTTSPSPPMIPPVTRASSPKYRTPLRSPTQMETV